MIRAGTLDIHPPVPASRDRRTREETVRTIFMLGVALTLASGAAARADDYPTDARASYVIECMGRNGTSAEMLQRCSCAIDKIAEDLTFERYVEAQTVLEMRSAGGERAGLFRSAQPARQMVDRFLEAQRTANAQCFAGASPSEAADVPQPRTGG
jgi:hypothetical protein